jgi:carboxylesterase type B
VAAQEQLSADLYANPDLARWGAEMLISMTPWQPVADGEVLTARPLERIATGVSAGVDLLIGTNSDEWRLFLVLGGLVEQATDEALAGCAAAYGLPVDATVAGYRAAHPGASPGDLLAALQGDWWCRVPAIRLADVQAQHNPATYMYEFAWRTPQFNGRLGACHLLEVPFVFDTLGYSTQTLWGNEPPQGLADTMHAAWVAFATTGDPGWPQYDLQHRPAMHFDISPEIVNDPFVRERALWAAVQ